MSVDWSGLSEADLKLMEIMAGQMLLLVAFLVFVLVRKLSPLRKPKTANDCIVDWAGWFLFCAGVFALYSAVPQGAYAYVPDTPVLVIRIAAIVLGVFVSVYYWGYHLWRINNGAVPVGDARRVVSADEILGG